MPGAAPCRHLLNCTIGGTLADTAWAAPLGMPALRELRIVRGGLRGPLPGPHWLHMLQHLYYL